MEREIIYSMRGPKNLAEMTTEEVAEELKHTDLDCVLSRCNRRAWTTLTASN